MPNNGQETNAFLSVQAGSRAASALRHGRHGSALGGSSADDRRRTISLSTKRPARVARRRLAPCLSTRSSCDKLVDHAPIGAEPADGGQIIEVDAFGEPQAHQQRLVGLLGLAQAHAFEHAMTAGLDALGPALGQPLGRRGVTGAADQQAAVRARPDAGVFAVAPVEQVVPALLARPRVVGDLVGRQARRARSAPASPRRGRAPPRPRGPSSLPRGVKIGERRLGLDGELIEREMLAGERQGFAKLAPPRGNRLPRPRVDEVEREALEGVARDPDRRRASATVCRRPSDFRTSSSSDCTPSETRLTPAAR